MILYRAVALSSTFSATLPVGAKLVVLGTGGTIAGTGHDASRPWAYQAGQLGVQQLVQAVPGLQAWGDSLVCEQVAQRDSKDMGWGVWRALALALQRHLADPDVIGVVVTHGTDTLEETAALLYWLVPTRRPIVLTAAMRPATAPDADGPDNLMDALHLVVQAHFDGQAGVTAVMHGRVWSARDVRKAHSHAIDAFDGGDEGPLAALRPTGPVAARCDMAMPPWPQGPALGWAALVESNSASLPLVLLVTSHAAMDAAWLRVLCDQPATRPAGIVVACTGHGTVHESLETVLHHAQAQGVVVWRSSRVARGGVCPRTDDTWPATGHWTAAQARLALQLHLMGVPLSPDTLVDA